MDVMTPIEKVFFEIGNLKLKAPASHQLVRVGFKGPMHTELINRQYWTVLSLNQVLYNIHALPVRTSHGTFSVDLTARFL